MKKVIAFILAAVMLMGLAACGSHSEDIRDKDIDAVDGKIVADGVAGIYRLIEVESDDDALAADEAAIATLESLGLISTLTVRDDGTASMSVFGEEMEGTWEADMVTVDGQSFKYAVDGNKLVVEEGTSKLIFIRTTDEEIAEIEAANEYLPENDEDSSDTYTSNIAAGRSAIVVEIGDTLFDNEYCSATVVSYDNENDEGFALTLSLENKTDNGLMFTFDDSRVNGYVVDPYWATIVDPGEVTEEIVLFYRSDLLASGVTSVDEVILPFTVYNSDDWSLDDYVDETYVLYPTGMSADDIVVPERITTEDEQVVVDDDICAFVVLGIDNDYFWDGRIRCYFENKTDHMISAMWDNVVVNGAPVDTYWSADMPVGARGYVDVTFYETAMEENDISTIEDVVFDLNVYDEDYDTLVEVDAFSYGVGE